MQNILEGKKKRIFICYSTNDKNFVIELANDLLISGMDIWIDRLEINAGNSLEEIIFKEGIANTDYFLIVLSTSSLKSAWVRKELNVAYAKKESSNNPYIIPIVIDDCNIPEILKDIKYIDFKNDYGLGLMEILKVIPTFISDRYNSAYVLSEPYIPVTRNEALLAYNRGNMLYWEGHLHEALNMFFLAIKLDPTLVDASYNIGVIEYNLAMRNEGLPGFTEMMKSVAVRYEFVLKLKKDDVDAMVNLAATYRNCKELENPENEYELLERAIKLAPNYALAHFNMGHFFAKYGGWKNIEDNLDKIKTEGSAEVTFKIEYLEQALKYYDTAGKLDKNLSQKCINLYKDLSDLIKLIKDS